MSRLVVRPELFERETRILAAAQMRVAPQRLFDPRALNVQIERDIGVHRASLPRGADVDVGGPAERELGVTGMRVCCEG